MAYMEKFYDDLIIINLYINYSISIPIQDVQLRSVVFEKQNQRSQRQNP